MIFVEGSINRKEFLDDDEYEEDKLEIMKSDVISAGDYQEAFDERFNNLEELSRPKESFFEKYYYFDRIFPSYKI